jgi:hypothetical protein
MSAADIGGVTTITVGRWINSYVSDDAAWFRGAEFRNAMDHIDRRVADELPERCGLWFQQAMRDSGEEVWRIRRLDLSFVVDVAAPGGCEVAQPWSERVVAQVLEVVAHGAEKDGVLRFPDHAAYQAQFICDVACGRAWSKWYYEEFQSLEHLPMGKAIVEVLIRDPGLGAQTMLHLARSGNFERILSILTRSDARAIYRTCFSGVSAGVSTERGPYEPRTPEAGFTGSFEELSRWSGLLLVIRNGLTMREADGSQDDDHDALRWITGAALVYPGAERDPAAYAAMNGLLALRRLLAAFRSPILADRLVRDLTGRRMSLDEAIATAWNAGAESPEEALRFLAHIAVGDPDWAAHAAASLRASPVSSPIEHKPRPNQAAFDDESSITRFGGVFLLGPSLADLRMKEVAEAAAGVGEQSQDQSAALRHLVLAKCLGRPRASDALSDPALRLFAGYRRSDPIRGMSLDPDRLDRARALFAENLIALSGSDGQFLLAEALEGPGLQDEVLLLRDLSQDLWLYMSPLPHETADREQALASAFDFARACSGSLPHVALAGSLAPLVQGATLASRVASFVSWHGDAASDEVVETLMRIGYVPSSTLPGKVMRLLASSQVEFSYYSFCDLWPDFNISLDLIGTLVSRAAVKGFARRLMGFQSASPEHLYRNFLEGVGTVHNRRERLEVELPRSPLSLVLQISGLAKQSFILPWLEEREVCLLPPRE